MPCLGVMTSEDVGSDGCSVLWMVKRDDTLGETGSAVRFVCFFRILRVASVVANWNCGRKVACTYHIVNV